MHSRATRYRICPSPEARAGRMNTYYLQRIDTERQTLLARRRARREVGSTCAVDSDRWWAHRCIFCYRDSGGGYRGWLGVAILHITACRIRSHCSAHRHFIVVQFSLLYGFIITPFVCTAVGIGSLADDAGGVSVYAIALASSRGSAEVIFFSHAGQTRRSPKYALACLLVGAGLYRLCLERPPCADIFRQRRVMAFLGPLRWS